jgi:hypothetical protein
MKNRVLMKRFGVTGFPSLYLLRNGQTWQYTGMRGVADVSWLHLVSIAAQFLAALETATCGSLLLLGLMALLGGTLQLQRF